MEKRIYFLSYLRPVEDAGSHLSSLVAVIVYGELAQHDYVRLLFLRQLGEDLGDVYGLKGVHLVCRHLHVDPSVSPHGQGCPDGFLSRETDFTNFYTNREFFLDLQSDN